jgi:hypothetical protein
MKNNLTIQKICFKGILVETSYQYNLILPKNITPPFLSITRMIRFIDIKKSSFYFNQQPIHRCDGLVDGHFCNISYTLFLTEVL